MSIAVAAMPGGGRCRRVLVCEGARHIVRLIQVVLERQGCSVVCTFDGEEAIRLMTSEELQDLPCFDLIVVDAMAPKVEGFEVLKWIRTHARTQNARVIMMFPREQNRDPLEERAFHADKYIVKPFNPMELLS